MSDLAYNANGEPFELPQSMAGWRVRKLKSKGAPEVVYGRNGLPLFLPLEADIEDLRREAREVGRYQLDPVDERKRAILNAEASHVCVPSVDLTPDPAAAPHATVVQLELLSRLINALLESQKQHAELARMYVSQFPVIVDALCSVIRAAGGAGLPQRATLIVPTTAAATHPEGARELDGDDGGEKDERGETTPMATVEFKDSWPKVLQSLLDHVGPSLGRLVSGLSGLGGDSGARVNELAVQLPEPSLVRGVEELGAPRGDAIAGAKDAAAGAVSATGRVAVQSRGANAQASEPGAQDRDQTAMPDADQTSGKGRDGWQGLISAPEANDVAAHVRARPDRSGPGIACPEGAAGDRGGVPRSDGAVIAMPEIPPTAPVRVSLVTSLTAEGPGSDRSAATSSAHGPQGVSSGPGISRPNRSTLDAEPVVSGTESLLAQALFAKPTIAPTSPDSPVQARAVRVGDVLAPAELATIRDRAAASSPARRDQRVAPTPTSPATDADVGTARRAQTAAASMAGEIAQTASDRHLSTDSAPANANANANAGRELSSGEPSRALPSIATAPPVMVQPGAGPPVPQEETRAATSDPDPRHRARGEPDADEKLTGSASAIRNGEPSRAPVLQPMSSVATPVSGPSPPPGSTVQYEVWPQATQTRDLLQAFIAAFRSLLADRTPVYLSPPMDTVSVPRCLEN
jgi:hypothetical protein